MNSLAVRVVCKNAKDDICECCSSLWNSIRDKSNKMTPKKTLRRWWRRLTNCTEIMDTQAVLFVRNRLVSTCESLLPIWSMYGEEQLGEEGGGGGGGGGRAGRRKGRDETLWEDFSLPESCSVEQLEHYLVHAIHSTTLDSQLQSIPREDVGRSTTVGKLPINTKKNRYKNNITYDNTRVVLEGNGESDYINASYIEGNGGPRDFIATQGPMHANERTIDDFWRMLWQNNSNVIVMVGNLVEGGRRKVSQYWPDVLEVKESYGQVNVEMTSEKEHVDYICRHFLVSLDTHSREVIQYQYIGWPDHDVPRSPFGAAHMVKDMARWRCTGPPVIHCSAGLGRTGTLLLVLRLLDDLWTKGHFHPLDTLRSLRKCRANLLDNQQQYRFAHHILLEILYGDKTRFPLDKLSYYLAFVKPELSNQYKELKTFPTSLTYNWARSHDPTLNRDSSVLPPDGRQILLTVNDHKMQYLNAVRVRGANLRDTFLVTEHPMAHTVSRCWKLAYMARASAWVFLHDHKSNNEEFPSVLPSHGYGELEGITVEVTSTVDKEFFTETSITVSQGEPHMMQLIQLKNWSPPKDVPNQPRSLVFLAEHILEIRRSSPSRVTMVSCSDGYSGSGVLVALVRMMAEARLTQQVDVYRTVQSLLFDRPQFIISQVQYFYLHDAILVYYIQHKRRHQEVREQARQTIITETDEREKKSQLKEEKERKTENNTRERSKTESARDSKAGKSVQEVLTEKRRETEGKGKRESKGKMLEIERRIVGEGEGKENERLKGDREKKSSYRKKEDERTKDNESKIKGTKGQNFDNIRQKGKGTKRIEVNASAYEKMWEARSKFFDKVRE